MNAPDYTALILRTEKGSALELIPEFGGLINSLKLGKHGAGPNLVGGLGSRQALQNDKIFRGIPLFPFVNRLDGGRYEHLGQRYQLPVNEPGRNNTLHGFLHHLAPQISVQQTNDSCTADLLYCYDGSLSGYPFPSTVRLTYALCEDALELTFAVTSRHHQPIPVGIGWHPYFTLGTRVDDLALRLPSVQEVLVDERMLPTGEKQDFTGFSKLTAIGSRNFDTCFAIRPNTSSGTESTVLWSEEQQLGLELWHETGACGFNFLQLCIAPDRNSIAIEPVSCGINAFNTGEGVVLLEPDKQLHARLGVRLITLPS